MVIAISNYALKNHDYLLDNASVKQEGFLKNQLYFIL